MRQNPHTSLSDLVEDFKVHFGGVVIVTPRDVGL